MQFSLLLFVRTPLLVLRAQLMLLVVNLPLFVATVARVVSPMLKSNPGVLLVLPMRLWSVQFTTLSFRQIMQKLLSRTLMAQLILPQPNLAPFPPMVLSVPSRVTELKPRLLVIIKCTALPWAMLMNLPDTRAQAKNRLLRLQGSIRLLMKENRNTVIRTDRLMIVRWPWKNCPVMSVFGDKIPMWWLLPREHRLRPGPRPRAPLSTGA